jgi:branched-chain amino acid transport system ATP-binding protein
VAELKLRDVTVQFGGLRAVDGVGLTVGDGQLVGVIGPNGAGKTTLIDAVTGIVPSRGEVLLGDRRLDGLPAHRRAGHGLVRTFQTIELFDDLTIRENLLVAAEPSSWAAMAKALFWARPQQQVRRKVDATLELLGIGELADRLPNSVSLGQRKLVTVARGLAASPRLLLLDEPAAGLDTEESLELGKTLRGITGTGVSILLVDHDMGLVLSVCDYIYVLDFGRIIAAGTPQGIASDQRVIDAYLGAEDQAPATVAGDAP